MATGGNLDGSDEIINIKCCICDKNNIRREAGKYCEECQVYYCSPCADTHKMFLPNASGHKLLDKADFGSTGLRSGLPSYPTERCSVHQAKLLDMFCKEVKEVNALGPTDETNCLLVGSCFTPDGLLLVSDCINICLKRIDVSSGLVKDSLDLKSRCADVCITNTFEAAVCLKDKSIQFVSLDNNMEAKQQLKLGYDCYGIACNNNQLFITDALTTLYIHDMKGNMLNKVTVDGTGECIFRCAIHVTAFGDRVYVADNVIKGLVILDTKGNYKLTFKHTDLASPWGVCTDRSGNIFVSGWGPSKIVQINEDPLSVLGVLDTVTNSTSACFDQHQNRLVITQFNSNSVKVYELK